MPAYQRFEDLPVWQEAARLYNEVLDLLQKPNLPFSAGFRNQLDRAALSVSNNIAEGFERTGTPELLQFLGIARGSAGEVRSMMAVIILRAEMKQIQRELSRVRTLAESCAKQLKGWAGSIESSPVQGKRHLTPQNRKQKEMAEKAQQFRLNFLRNLKPEHPLYNSSEAKAAREGQQSG